MKISNSKKELARIISENGGWRDGAEFSAQDKDDGHFKSAIHFYDEKPSCRDSETWYSDGFMGYSFSIECKELSPNWHQTILSRDEYFHLYPAPDADGWVEWKGGECPVDVGTIVDVKHRDGDIGIRCHAGMSSSEPDGEGHATAEDWSHLYEGGDIIAYRLHKSERANPKSCKPVTRSIPEVEAKPTLEQLAADYRSKLDYANRKQDEADKANMDSDAALSQLEDAIAAIGFVITPLAATEKEPELVITDWRQWRVGDVVSWSLLNHAGEFEIISVHHDQSRNIGDFAVKDKHGGVYRAYGNECRFIRRP